MTHAPEITPEQERLIEAIARETTRRLVASPAGRSIAGTGVDREDLLMEARLACFVALRSYDPTRGVKIETWMIAKARGAVYEGLREADVLSRSERTRYKEQCRQARTQELAEPPPPRAMLSFEDLLVEVWDEETGERQPAAPQPRITDPEIEAAPDRLALAAAFDALTGRVSPAAILVADWHLKEEITLKECAGRLKLSESRAHQLMDDARAVMRRSIEGGWLPPALPRRHDGAWREPFLAAVARGTGFTLACRIAGIDESHPVRYAKAHPAFAAALTAARDEGGAVRKGSEWREPFLTLVRQGMPTKEATQKLRIHPFTPSTIAARCPEFKAAWTTAKSAALPAPEPGLPPRQQAFIDRIAAGWSTKAAREAVGFDRTTPFTAQRRSPRFKAAWNTAREAAKLTRAA